MRVTEGNVELEVPLVRKTVKKDEVFYNPEMVFNRDLSVLALKTWLGRRKSKLAVDCLAASGVRGLRYAKTCPTIEKTIINDLNPTAVKLMRKNARLNKLKNVEVTKKDANVLLSELKYSADIIDIDPFGSPMPFLDSAGRAMHRNGFLGVTATDTAPLCGTYPAACLRKYGAIPLREDVMHEAGVRILIGAIVRTFARHELGFKPLLSFTRIHYFRAMGRAEAGRAKADAALGKLGYLWYCRKCGDRGFSKEKRDKCGCGKKLDNAGPLWTGRFSNPLFCRRMAKKAETEEAKAFLERIAEESKIKAPFVDLHDYCTRRRLKALKRDDVIERLRKWGFGASRTHFSLTGVRTDTPIALRKVFSKRFS